MMKVLRLIIYEGEDTWMKEQLSRSLPNGTKTLSPTNTISAVTLSRSLPNGTKTLSPTNTISVVTLGSIPDYLSLLFKDEREDKQ
jgi:hypothetical protein